MDELPLLPLRPYTDIRPEIQSGDLLLCSGSSPMSQMIQAATASMWSHVGFVWCHEAIDRLLVWESVESIGIRAGTLSRYVYNYNNTGSPYPGRVVLARHAGFAAVDPGRLVLFSQRAVDLLNSAYDTKQILGIAARIVAAKLGMAPRPIENNDSFICSEFVNVCYRSIGIDIPYNAANFIAPADFAACLDVHLLWEIDTRPVTGAHL